MESFLGDFVVAEADVLSQRAGEEERILQDHGEVLAQSRQILLAEIDAVDENLAGGDIVEAHHEAGEGGFSRTGVADDGYGLAGLNGEGNIFENPLDVFDGGQCGRVGN